MENKENLGEIVIFNSEDGEVKVQIDAINETIWLTQKGMAELFGCTIENIIVHIKNVYKEGELQEPSTTKENLVVQKEGNRNVKRKVKMYNLDTIVSVGFRVNIAFNNFQRNLSGNPQVGLSLFH